MWADVDGENANLIGKWQEQVGITAKSLIRLPTNLPPVTACHLQQSKQLITGSASELQSWINEIKKESSITINKVSIMILRSMAVTRCRLTPNQSIFVPTPICWRNGMNSPDSIKSSQLFSLFPGHSIGLRPKIPNCLNPRIPFTHFCLAKIVFPSSVLQADMADPQQKARRISSEKGRNRTKPE